MPHSLSRRRLLALAPAATVGSVIQISALTPGAGAQTHTAESVVPEFFPQQDRRLVNSVVAFSHSNLERVKELVERRPALARASWDWGFGDWESALGAASHTGRREIAEFLLANGARPTLFSAAMLGQLEVVRAAVETTPGIQRTPGPHGIPLLAHARAGKDAAASVVTYLEQVGDADHRPPVFSDDAAAQSYLGTYTFGPLDREQITVAFTRERLQLGVGGGNNRNLHSRSEPHSFHPAGAPDVTIAFTIENDRATTLTIEDGDISLVAERIEG